MAKQLTGLLGAPFGTLPESEDHRKGNAMKNKVMTIIFSFVLVAGSAAAVSTACAQDQDIHGSGEVHVTKNCAGSVCTVTSSNLAAIPAGSKIYYVTTPAFTGLMMDRNIFLYVGLGNWAVGRCTLDFSATFPPATTPPTPSIPPTGLCTLSDGIGQFAGFQARVDVSTSDLSNYKWEGTYSFNPEQSRKR